MKIDTTAAYFSTLNQARDEKILDNVLEDLYCSTAVHESHFILVNRTESRVF
jgi:hypothetical protein